MCISYNLQLSHSICCLWCEQGKGITDILMGPAKLKDTIPGISGTRNLSDNLSDLKAQVPEHSHSLACHLLACHLRWAAEALGSLYAEQVAANNKGIGLVGDLIAEYGLPTVQAYMHHIQVSRDCR